MRSARLSFNIPLFKKQSKRFWSLWSLYSFWLLISMPVVLYLKTENARDVSELLGEFEEYIASMAGTGAAWLQFAFCLLVAMALWSYLYNNRSVSMLHALPITRGTHFLTNYITGLAFCIVPSVVTFGVSLCVQAASGTVTLRALGFWLLSQVLTSVFFFSFATLMAFITGNIFALPVIYGVFSILPKAIVMLVDSIFSSFVYGYAGNWGVLSWIGEMLSPIYTLGGSRQYSYRYTSMMGGKEVFTVYGLNTMIAYAVAGLVMAALAYLLYRRRRLELCGEVITVGALRPVFKYGFTLCASLAGGYAFYEMFSGSISQGIGTLTFFLLLWAAIGYFSAEMLLRKSARIFRKSMPGCIASLLIIVAVILGMEYDLTGYERHIPEVDRVVSVRLHGVTAAELKVPGDIVSLRALHRILVEQKDEIEREHDRYMQRYYYGNERNDADWDAIIPITIDYQLDNGQGVTRSYNVLSSAKRLADPTSAIARYNALINTAQAVTERSFPKALGEAQPKSVDISLVKLKSKPLPQVAGVDAPIDGNYTDADSVEISLSGEVARGLYAAVRADMAAGRAGKVALVEYSDAEAERIYLSPLYFTFTDIYNGTDTKSVSERYNSSYSSYGWSQTEQADGMIVLNYAKGVEITKEATETIAFLKSLGIDPETHLRSYAQMRREGEPTRYEDDKSLMEPEAGMQTEATENLS